MCNRNTTARLTRFSVGFAHSKVQYLAVTCTQSHEKTEYLVFMTSKVVVPMTFKSGQDKSGGRVAGTPNKATQLSRQLALPFVDEAMQALVDVLRDQEAPHAARISAANSILDRAFGKPRQEVEHAGDAQPLQIMIKHFSADAANCVEPTELDEQPRQHA